MSIEQLIQDLENLDTLKLTDLRKKAIELKIKNFDKDDYKTKADKIKLVDMLKKLISKPYTVPTIKKFCQDKNIISCNKTKDDLIQHIREQLKKPSSPTPKSTKPSSPTPKSTKPSSPKPSSPKPKSTKKSSEREKLLEESLEKLKQKLKAMKITTGYSGITEKETLVDNFILADKCNPVKDEWCGDDKICDIRNLPEGPGICRNEDDMTDKDLIKRKLIGSQDSLDKIKFVAIQATAEATAVAVESVEQATVAAVEAQKSVEKSQEASTEAAVAAAVVEAVSVEKDNEEIEKMKKQEQEKAVKAELAAQEAAKKVSNAQQAAQQATTAIKKAAEIAAVAAELPPPVDAPQAPYVGKGMKNCGTTCYLNSVIQSLWSVSSFRDSFIAIADDKLNITGVALKNIFKSLSRKTDSKVVDIIKLSVKKGTVEKSALDVLLLLLKTKTGKQQDANDFVNNLFTEIAKSKTVKALLSKTFRISELSQLDCEYGRVDKKTNPEDWLEKGDKNDPGSLQIVIKIEKDIHSIQSGLNTSENIKDIEACCKTVDNCVKGGKGTKNDKISLLNGNPPTNLLITLGRMSFDYNTKKRSFNDTKITINKTIIIENTCFRLAGYIWYDGSAGAGHYTFFKCDVEGNDEYEYNDPSVTRVYPKNSQITTNGYIFIYRKLDECPEGLKAEVEELNKIKKKKQDQEEEEEEEEDQEEEEEEAGEEEDQEEEAEEKEEESERLESDEEESSCNPAKGQWCNTGEKCNIDTGKCIKEDKMVKNLIEKTIDGKKFVGSAKAVEELEKLLRPKSTSPKSTSPKKVLEAEPDEVEPSDIEEILTTVRKSKKTEKTLSSVQKEVLKCLGINY